MTDRGDSARTLVAFDLETTGLNPERNEIIEIGAVRFVPGERPSDEFAELVKPSGELPRSITERTGITAAMLADAAPVADVLARFVAWCGEDRVLVAHNAPFDAEFLLLEARRHGVTLPGEWGFVDTLDWARLRIPDARGYELGKLLTRIRFTPPGEAHRALADAHGVAALVGSLWKGYKRPGQALAGRVLPLGEMARPPATQPQLDYLQSLGVPISKRRGLTKRKASELIDEYRDRQPQRRESGDESPSKAKTPAPGCSSLPARLAVAVVALLFVLWFVSCLT